MSEQRTIEAFAVTRIKDEEVPRPTASFPMSNGALTHLLENCPVILVRPSVTEPSLPFNDTADATGFGEATSVDLRQVSASHCRSFEVNTPNMAASWQDEFGNTYASLSLKGNNFSSPGIMEHPTAAEDYIAYGLQESSIIERVLRASRIMRSRHISTEYIMGIAEPKLYPLPLYDGTIDATEFVGLKEYKRRLINEHWEALPDDERTPETHGNLNRIFKDMTFYVTLRATDNAYRLHDMKSDHVQSAVYEHVNKQLPAGKAPFRPGSIEDFNRFLGEIFAPASGENLAKLHPDLAHRFAHGLNLTALGGIVDLDSVHGEVLGLGDATITEEDRVGDLIEISNAIATTLPIYGLLRSERASFTAFIQRYCEQTLAQADYALEAFDSLATRLNLLTQYLQSGRWKYGDEEARVAMIQDYYVGLYETHRQPIPTESIQAGIFNSIRTYQLDEQTLAGAKELFADSVGVYAMMLNNDFINEIDEGDASDNHFDIYDAFMASFESNLESAKEEMLLELRNFHRYRLIAYVTGHSQSLAGDWESEPEAVQQLVGSKVLRDLQPDINNWIKEQLKQLVVMFEPELRKELDYVHPSSIFPEAESFLSVTIQDNRLWRLTDKVSQQEVENYLKEHDIDYFVTCIVSEHDREVTVTTDKDYYLLEVISDARSDGHSFTHDLYTTDINICYTEPPSYILLVEQDHEGNLAYTMQRADFMIEEAMEIRPLPDDDSLTLF